MMDCGLYCGLRRTITGPENLIIYLRYPLIFTFTQGLIAFNDIHYGFSFGFSLQKPIKIRYTGIYR